MMAAKSEAVVEVTIGPLEQLVLSTACHATRDGEAGVATLDDVLDAVAALAGVLDRTFADIADAIERGDLTQAEAARRLRRGIDTTREDDHDD